MMIETNNTFVYLSIESTKIHGLECITWVEPNFKWKLWMNFPNRISHKFRFYWQFNRSLPETSPWPSNLKYLESAENHCLLAWRIWQSRFKSCKYIFRSARTSKDTSGFRCCPPATKIPDSKLMQPLLILFQTLS